MPEQTLGALLRDYRKRRGFTQARLAELANISERAITYYEANERMPSLPIMVLLVMELRIPWTKVEASMPATYTTGTYRAFQEARDRRA